MPLPAVFDAHVDTLLKAGSAAVMASGAEGLQLDLARARHAGVRQLVCAVCAEPRRDAAAALRHGLRVYRGLPDDTGIDLMLMMEGCDPLLDLPAGELDLASLSFAALTWNGENRLAGGMGSDVGLKPDGRRMLRELRCAGVVPDVSHLCDRSRREMLSEGGTLVATHCNCRRLCDFPRNLADDDIRAIADTGGVVGITFVPDFLGGSRDLARVLEHVDHAVAVAGIEHVGFGSDFDGIRELPSGIPGCEAWPDILEGLEGLGWPPEGVEAVAGGNWRRLADEPEGGWRCA